MTGYVVGCDMGLTKSGIVVLDKDRNIQSQNLIKVKTNAAQRLLDIERGFEHIVQPYTNNITVFIEGYAYEAKYQRESLAELGGVMRHHFCSNSIDYWVIPPTTLKYFVTGNGRATKNFMKKGSRDKWGLIFKSDDVCDAHGLARLGVEVLRTVDSGEIDPSLPICEKEVINEVSTYRDHYINANTASRSKTKFSNRKTNK